VPGALNTQTITKSRGKSIPGFSMPMKQQTVAPCLWQKSTSPATLANAAIHVWCVYLRQPIHKISQLAQHLSLDEHERADRFVFDRDRGKYIVARGTLRLILGHYLHTPPEQLQFRYGLQNKPYLAKIDNHLQFNLAHSHNLALYAITRHQELGVDIEAIRPMDDKEQMAQRFFSAAEYTTLVSLPEEQKLVGFFNCWTRKEAFLKATGEGLTRPLDQFNVSLTPGVPAELLSIEGSTQAAEQWSLFELKPAEEYIGAVAIPGKNWQVSRWCWSE